MLNDGLRQKFSEILLVLDFDGVIWDSVYECFFVISKVMRNHGIELVEQEFEIFRRGRYLCRTGEDFFHLIDLIRTDPSFDPERLSLEDFRKSMAESKTPFAEFAGEFYAARRDMLENDFEIWSALQKPMPGIIEKIGEFAGLFKEIAIATTKDEKSVRHLLALHDLDFKILGREFDKNKKNQLERLSALTGTGFDRIVFVDDLLENLLPVKELGIKVALASWGYNIEKEIDRARSLDIPVINRESLIEDLAGAIVHGK